MKIIGITAEILLCFFLTVLWKGKIMMIKNAFFKKANAVIL